MTIKSALYSFNTRHETDHGTALRRDSILVHAGLKHLQRILMCESMVALTRHSCRGKVPILLLGAPVFEVASGFLYGRTHFFSVEIMIEFAIFSPCQSCSRSSLNRIDSNRRQIH